jgi:hypothetical protein
MLTIAFSDTLGVPMITIRRALLVLSLLCVAGCHTRTIHVVPPPSNNHILSFNERAALRGRVTLSGGDQVIGTGWYIDSTSVAYRDAAGTQRTLRLQEVRRVDFPLQRREAALLGTWRGAAIGVPLGAVLGLLIWQDEGSCSPQPCTPAHGKGEAKDVWTGAVVVGAIGAAIGASVGVAGGGRLTYRIGPRIDH